MNDNTQVNIAVEALCVTLVKVGVLTLPAHVKGVLLDDIRIERAHVPSVHECASLVSAALERQQPAWFCERWPQTFVMVSQLLHA
jgi:hypothetical protein